MMFLVVFMFLYWCQPFVRCGYRTARKQLGYTILQILMAPFGKVRFRDFFFADVITSMGEPLKDFGTIVFFMASQDEYVPTSFSDKIYKILPYYMTLVSFLPYWWRFCQCINKYYNQNAVP